MSWHLAYLKVKSPEEAQTAVRHINNQIFFQNGHLYKLAQSWQNGNPHEIVISYFDFWAGKPSQHFTVCELSALAEITGCKEIWIEGVQVWPEPPT